MPTPGRSPVIHTLRYRDAPAAIEWLCDVFGFEKHLVVPGEDNTIAHAQLQLGNGMIMLGSEPHEGAFGEVQKAPRSLGGGGLGQRVPRGRRRRRLLRARQRCRGGDRRRDRGRELRRAGLFVPRPRGPRLERGNLRPVGRVRNFK